MNAPTHNTPRRSALRAGQGLVEYAVIIALAGIALLVVLPGVHGAIQQNFQGVVSGIAQAPQWEPIAWEYAADATLPGNGSIAAPADSDSDGVTNDVDNCPDVANPAQADSDFDGFGNVCDLTPNGDSDMDNIDALVDNCPDVANPDQVDLDGDGQGNACDITPYGDNDHDGIDNLGDNCPDVANPDQADQDGDGQGNVCDPTVNGDSDGDGIDNLSDNCPVDSNADQADIDRDGLGDPCDTTPNGDSDLDGVDNLSDNCPLAFNPDQVDNDSDTLGNACDATSNGDADYDGIGDESDNCPTVGNADQTDVDADGLGNACDSSYTFRMNFGTDRSYTDASGNVWTATMSSFSDGMAGTTTRSIANTSDPALFQSNWRSTNSTLAWAMSNIPNGSYTLSLYFAEINPNKAARFDIAVQGSTLTRGFRPADAGDRTAVVLTYPNIQVTNGSLTLLLTKVQNASIISALVLTNVP